MLEGHLLVEQQVTKARERGHRNHNSINFRYILDLARRSWKYDMGVVNIHENDTHECNALDLSIGLENIGRWKQGRRGFAHPSLSRMKQDAKAIPPRSKRVQARYTWFCRWNLAPRKLLRFQALPRFLLPRLASVWVSRFRYPLVVKEISLRLESARQTRFI